MWRHFTSWFSPEYFFSDRIYDSKITQTYRRTVIDFSVIFIQCFGIKNESILLHKNDTWFQIIKIDDLFSVYYKHYEIHFSE